MTFCSIFVQLDVELKNFEILKLFVSISTFVQLLFRETNKLGTMNCMDPCPLVALGMLAFIGKE
jgi:hypothetical protein